MKKTITFLSAFILVCAAATCTNGNVENSQPTEDIKVTQTMYKEERADFPEDMLFYGGIGYVEGSGVRLIYTDKEGDKKFADYDENMKLKSTTELFTAENEYRTFFSISDDGCISELVMYVDSEVELGAEDYFEKADISYELCKYSADGKEESTVVVNGMNNYFNPTDDFIRSCNVVDGRCFFITSAGQLMIDENGEITDSRDAKDFVCYCTDCDGKFVAADDKGYSYMDSVSLDVPEKMTAYGEYLSLNFNLGIAEGHDGYKLFFMLNDGIFGLTENDSVVKILDYNKSLMSGQDYSTVIYAGKGSFAAIGYDNNKSYLAMMTVRPDDYIMDRKTVLVGCQSDSGICPNEQAMAAAYNKKSDKHIVEMKVYSGIDDVKEDVLAGSPPDVFAYGEAADMYRLANLGAAANMYELSEKYGGFRKEDIKDNVITAMEYKNGLYAMCQTFQLPINLGSKNLFPAGNMNWDEFYEIMENAPDDMYFSYQMGCSSPEDVFSYLCTSNLGSWVDFQNAECYFDTPEFKRFLEFTKTVNLFSPMNMAEFYKNNTDEEAQIFFQEERNRVKNGTAMLIDESISHLWDIVRFRNGYGLTDEEIVYVNSPSDKPSGQIAADRLYSVIANGNNIEGGWDYVNFLLSDDFLTSYENTKSGLVTRRESFDKIVEEQQWYSENPVFINENGETQYVFSFEGVVITDEDIDKLNAYIDTCTLLKGHDDAISDIASEEYSAFIAGDKTADECAELIQNRVSIYLSENL